MRRERLHAALQRVAQRLALRRGAAAPGASAEDVPAIVVTDRGRVVRVPLAEVLYLKAELKYVTLRTAEHSLRARRFAVRPGAAPGRALPARAPQRAGRAQRGARARAPRRVAGEGDEEGGEGWAVRMAPVDEWLAVSRRQVAAVREALVAAGR